MMTGKGVDNLGFVELPVNFLVYIFRVYLIFTDLDIWVVVGAGL